LETRRRSWSGRADSKILGSAAFGPAHYQPGPLSFFSLTRACARETKKIKVLGTVSSAAQSAGVVCDTLHIEHDQIYRAIIDAASARRYDSIVMASHGRRGILAVVLGSETVKVLTHSKIPVLVYR
jgi:nucleotide-binding universal stress UspA family protein